MLKRLAVAALAMSVAGCGGSRAQPSTISPTGGNEYATQADRWLARQAETIRGQGYTRIVAGPVHGSLRDDETGTHMMDVVGGNAYALFGACDNDCTDFDLKIYDTAGNLLMQDIAVDDHPTLLFTANGTGRYRVQAIMATCSRSPCFYAVELMAR